ncbi:MAG: DUF1634 domain-containing protein [Thermoguttaceae bacterium]
MRLENKRLLLSNEKFERIIGNLLRTGVLLAAGVVATGAIIYLARYGSSKPDYQTFRGEPSDLRSLGAIIRFFSRFMRAGSSNLVFCY